MPGNSKRYLYFSESGYSPDLIVLSLFAFCLLIVRACIQSVTIDEADAFMAFATRGGELIWYPAAQNHILYTLLERLSWNIFGFNQVAMRLPALLGAAIYLVSAVRIGTAFSGRVFRLSIFVCLALNPFVLDYLVAARGYSLAVALLLAAIAVFWSSVTGTPDRGPVALWCCALISVLLGLSFAANFSFAIVDIIAGLVFLAGVVVSDTGPRRRVLPIVLWGALPGIAVALFFCAYTLSKWPSGEFVFGAHSLHDMRVRFFRDLFPPPNPEIVNPLINKVWARMSLPLCLAAFVVLATQLGAMLSIRRIRETIQVRPTLLVSAALSVIVVFTVGFHWLAFRAFGLYLPMGRTAVFFVPLLTLILAAGTDVFRRMSLRRFALPGVTILAACSIYYLSALRLHYFQEWRFNEDTKTVFWVIRDVEIRCGIHEFSTEWRYAPTLNFYRRQYENRTMKPFTAAFMESLPLDKRAYVLYYPDAEQFVAKNALAIWYQNQETGAAVAIRSCPANNAQRPEN